MMAMELLAQGNEEALGGVLVSMLVVRVGAAL